MIEYSSKIKISNPRPAVFRLENTSDPSRFHLIQPIPRQEVSKVIDFCKNYKRHGTAPVAKDRADLWRHYSKVYAFLTRAPQYQNMVKTIVNMVAPHLPNFSARVLNLGAGTGAAEIGFLESFGLGRFERFEMVEMNPHMQNEAKRIFSDIFEDTSSFVYNRSSIQDIRYSGNFDAVISSLAITFLADRSTLTRSLLKAHSKLGPGSPVVHVVHKKEFNPPSIAAGYCSDVLLGARGGLFSGLSELYQALPSMAALLSIGKVISNNQRPPSLYDEGTWTEIFGQTGIKLQGNKPMSVYSNQALLFYGLKN